MEPTHFHLRTFALPSGYSSQEAQDAANTGPIIYGVVLSPAEHWALW